MFNLFNWVLGKLDRTICYYSRDYSIDCGQPAVSTFDLMMSADINKRWTSYSRRAWTEITWLGEKMIQPEMEMFVRENMMLKPTPQNNVCWLKERDDNFHLHGLLLSNVTSSGRLFEISIVRYHHIHMFGRKQSTHTVLCSWSWSNLSSYLIGKIPYGPL